MSGFHLGPIRGGWAPGIGFFEDRHNLRFGELRLAHGNLLARMTIVPECSPNGCLDLGGAYELNGSEEIGRLAGITS